jgi:hypothetical protein
MSVITYEIIKLSNQQVIFREDSPKDMIIERMRRIGLDTTNLLSFLESEYREDFFLNCEHKTEAYQMILTDTETQQVFTAVFDPSK